jgi:ArsR family transcriptional regulator
MAYAKKEQFSTENVRLARFGKAMAHPARIAILKKLALRNNCYFSEIADDIPLADSTVSQHLAELKKAGLIEWVYEPPRIKYFLNIANWKQVRKYYKEFMKTKSENN